MAKKYQRDDFAVFFFDERADHAQKDFYDEKSVMIDFKYEQDTLDLKRDAFKRYGDTVSGIVKCIQRTGGAQYFHRKAVSI